MVNNCFASSVLSQLEQITSWLYCWGPGVSGVQLHTHNKEICQSRVALDFFCWNSFPVMCQNISFYTSILIICCSISYLPYLWWSNILFLMMMLNALHVLFRHSWLQSHIILRWSGFVCCYVAVVTVCVASYNTHEDKNHFRNILLVSIPAWV